MNARPRSFQDEERKDSLSSFQRVTGQKVVDFILDLAQPPRSKVGHIGEYPANTTAAPAQVYALAA
jgi:hypothetical protein